MKFLEASKEGWTNERIVCGVFASTRVHAVSMEILAVLHIIDKCKPNHHISAKLPRQESTCNKDITEKVILPQPSLLCHISTTRS